MLEDFKVTYLVAESYLKFSFLEQFIKQIIAECHTVLNSLVVTEAQ